MSVVRLPGFQVVKTVAVGTSPRSIAVNGDQIFVTDVVGQKIAVLQRHRLTVTRWIPVPRLTEVIAVNGRYIAASFTESGDWAEVAILDTATGQVLRRIPLPTFAVDISVDGPDFLVSLLNANAVIKLHPTSAGPLSAEDPGEPPHGGPQATTSATKPAR
jgi:hypothetical protein